jgi:hypothetical protein
MPPVEAGVIDLPDDSESLRAMVRSLLEERDGQRQRAEEQQQRAKEQQLRVEELRVEMLRLQLELERFKRWYYGPRADRLQCSGELAQLLLNFAQELDRRPVHPDDVPPHGGPEEELRRVKRRRGRRHLANFENLHVTTRVHELSGEQRACPCCGVERKEIGAEESWQVEYLPGRFGDRSDIDEGR